MVNLRWGRRRRSQTDPGPDGGLEPGGQPDLEAVADTITDVAARALGKPATLADGPEPVLVGHGPDAYRFSLVTDDPSWTGALLARCSLPGALDQEVAWVRAVRAAGFPAPELLTQPPGQGALVVREPAGESLIECMLTDMTSVPRLLAELGELHARLHNLPADGLPAPASASADRQGLAGAATDPAVSDGLADELAWLDAHAPPPGRAVACHSELHPAHVFVDPEDPSSAVVTNWTAARRADPERDVASTLTAFWFAPFYLENAMYRKGLEMARDTLASGYLDAYRTATSEPLDDGRLRYWQAFRVGVLASDLARHLREGPTGPWDPLTAVIKPQRTLEDLRKRFWELAGS